jgi:hypothetical protein
MSQLNHFANPTRRIHKSLGLGPIHGQVSGIGMLLVTCIAIVGTAQAGSVQLVNVQQPASISSGGILTSEWSYQAQESQASVVTWSCPVFSQEQQAENKVDAAIQIVIVDQAGPVSCIPVLTRNQTHWRNGSEQAIVSVLIQGTGTGRLRVMVKMAGESDLTKAGQYSTSVQVHVQSR